MSTPSLKQKYETLRSEVSINSNPFYDKKASIILI